MTDIDRELMERYIYEVVRRLPKEQREEITLELRELIEDMAEDNDIYDVLDKLGEPTLFAQQYRSENRFLISPDYYDNYMWVLKIVLGAVLLSSIISSVVQGGLNNQWLQSIFKNLITNSFISFIGAFGLVTLIFAIMERQHIKIDLKKEKLDEKQKWSPQLLDPVPDKKALISRSESVVSIIFTFVFSGLLIFAPYLFGAYVYENNVFVKIIPLFNLEYWNVILPFVLGSFMIGFVDDLIKLVKGCYCNIVMISSIITGVAEVILACFILKVLPLWNMSFTREIKSAYDFEEFSMGDILYYFERIEFSDIILAIVVLGACLSVGTTIYKTIRYGTKD